MIIFEVLTDAFFIYRAPSESVALEEAAPPKPRVPPGLGRSNQGELKGIVDLSLKLHDQQASGAAVTSERISRLVALTSTLAGVLWAWLQWMPAHVGSAAALYGRALVTVGLYLALKVMFHVLWAMYARPRQSIKSDLVEVGERCAAGHDIRQDLVDVLYHVRIIASANEKSRAISVEHSMLALHTALVQVLVTVIVLIGSIWAPLFFSDEVVDGDTDAGAPVRSATDPAPVSNAGIKPFGTDAGPAE